DATGVLASTDTIYDPLGRVLATSRQTANGAPVARYPLNETTGKTAADAAGNAPAVSTGIVSWTTDHGGAFVNNGVAQSALVTSAPAVDTTRSFSVSAWVTLTDPPSGNKTAVGQDGTRRSGFFLGNDSAVNRWRIQMCPPNTDAGNCVEAGAT